MRFITLPGVDAPQGRWVGLSLPRRFVCDLMRHAKAVPSIPSQRRMQLAEVIETRENGIVNRHSVPNAKMLQEAVR